MKTVTEQQKKDFREEQNYITLAFSGGATLTNNDIVLDSMRITRTLCDSEQISFNTVYASEFSIQIFNDGRKYDGQTVTVSLTAGTYSVNLGTYTVVSNPRSNDRLYRTLTAYDSIAAVLSKNYADWHNGLKNNPPTTIGAYRTAFFNHIGITQQSVTLCNDATAFKYAETTGALSGATILGELCSINGTFGYLDFDQVFRWVTPYIDASGMLVPSLTLYPSTTLYPASVDTAIESLGVDTYKVDTDSYDLGGLACEEFITHNITQVYMHQGDVVYASGTDGNRLTITNTLFIMEPTVAVQAVANIKATVKDFNYTPTSITMLATPWLELCDVVVAEVSSTEKVYFPVLNFVINGTGAIRQTIEAKGVMVNSDEATNTDYKIITASNSADYAAELARQAQQAANSAQESADTAQETADNAQTAADTAQQTADDAQTAADTAQQTADDAQTAADNAQTAADTAQQAADTAQTAADTAQETAEAAQDSADTAQETAETAQTTAEEAKATFGICSTVASIANKVVVCENFKLEVGAVITVLFTHPNTVASPTININNTGDKPIYVNGTAPTATTNPLQWTYNTYINFVYDGTAFNVTDTPGAYTGVCQTGDSTAQKVVDPIDNVIIMNGITLNVTFFYAQTSGLSLGLAIEDTTSRNCYFEGTQITSSNPFTWVAGNKIAFTLTNGYWVITDSGATRKAIEAGKTATNYLHFSNNKGLVVSQSPVTSDAQVEALTTPNSRVVSDGFDVYKNGTTRVAHFGEQTILGQNGQAQQVIDSDSLAFNSGNGTTVFEIENGVESTGESAEMWVSIDGTYLDGSGAIDVPALANIIDGMATNRQATSATGDFVTTTTGAQYVMELSGYGMVSGSNTPYMTASTGLAFYSTLTNGVLSVRSSSETESSDWYDFINDFVALFPSGTTDYLLHLNFILTYKIADVQMTLGTRKENSTIGAKSVSIGSNNIASGTGAVAMGRGLKVYDDYSMIVGETNVDIENANTGDHMPTAFAVGAGGSTPFAVLKNGIMIMSAVNSGQSPQRAFGAFTRTDVRIDFQYEYPSTPFVFLTLNEDNVPNNQGDITDYGRIQIYKKAVDTTGFTATVVNGSDTSHTFNFSWFAISVL